MNKVSSTDAASLLHTMAASLRKVAQERDTLQEKVASYERTERCVKIARDMDEKGLHADLSFEEKVASVQKSQNLDATEEAVKMAAPQGHILGNLGEDQPGVGMSALETYIITGEDPTE